MPPDLQNVEKSQFQFQLAYLEASLDKLELLVDRKIASQKESSGLKFEYSSKRLIRFAQHLQRKPLYCTAMLSCAIVGIMSILEGTYASSLVIRVMGAFLTFVVLLNTVVHTDVIIRQIRCLIRRNGIETLKQISLTYATYVLNYALLCYLYELCYPGSYRRIDYNPGMGSLKSIYLFLQTLYFSQMFVATAAVGDVTPRYFFGKILCVLSTIYSIVFQAILFNNFIQ